MAASLCRGVGSATRCPPQAPRRGGTTMMTTTIPSIERRFELQAPPDRVWRALTEPREIAAWFGNHADFRAESGAPGSFDWGPEGTFSLRVEAVDPGHYLAYRWARDPNVPLDAGPTT